MIFKVLGLYGSSIHMYQCKQCLTRLCCKFYSTLGDQAYLIQIYVIKCVSRNTENQKNEQHRPYQKPGVNPGPYEGVPASYKTPAMLLIQSRRVGHHYIQMT